MTMTISRQTVIPITETFEHKRSKKNSSPAYAGKKFPLVT
jgi:hypothetical protein